MKLRKAVSKNKQVNKSRAKIYEDARKVFWVLFNELRRGNSIPSTKEFDTLYLALRWSGQISSQRKQERWAKVFKKNIVASCMKHVGETSGIIGGAKGSIAPDLRKAGNRARLWKLMVNIAKTASQQHADALLMEFSKKRMPGVVRGVFSPFLWALKPKWYQIVNGGNIQGIQKAIADFPVSKDLEQYVLFDVPCLRRFCREYRIKDNIALDRLFLRLSQKNVTIDDDSMYLYEPTSVISEKVFEGEEYEQRIKSRKRSSKARRELLLKRGPKCQICDFEFQSFYGVEYAEVHHVEGLAKTGTRFTNIDKDLLVVCRNCHAMLHAKPFAGGKWTSLRRRVLALRIKRSRTKLLY